MSSLPSTVEPAGGQLTLPLDEQERSRLHECEDRIRRGLSVFKEVGEALATVRDLRLYRETHSSFEAYCVEKWEISRSQGYALIDAAEVVTSLEASGIPDIPIPTNPAQARPLNPLTPEERVEVMQEVGKQAEETGKPITAATIQEAVDRKKMEEFADLVPGVLFHCKGNDLPYVVISVSPSGADVLGIAGPHGAVSTWHWDQVREFGYEVLHQRIEEWMRPGRLVRREDGATFTLDRYDVASLEWVATSSVGESVVFATRDLYNEFVPVEPEPQAAPAQASAETADIDDADRAIIEAVENGDDSAAAPAVGALVEGISAVAGVVEAVSNVLAGSSAVPTAPSVPVVDKRGAATPPATPPAAPATRSAATPAPAPAAPAAPTSPMAVCLLPNSELAWIQDQGWTPAVAIAKLREFVEEPPAGAPMPADLWSRFERIGATLNPPVSALEFLQERAEKAEAHLGLTAAPTAVTEETAE